MTDRNGVEIYEGDIVQAYVNNKKHGKHKVEYRENSYLMSPIDSDYDDANIWWNVIEVIGNTHEGVRSGERKNV